MSKTRTTRVRWMIMAMLGCFSLVSYVERVNISVAAEFMMPELHLSRVAMGQIFSSFLWGYGLLQVPAGLLGDRFGPRLVLALAALGWAVATLLTGLMPGWIVAGPVGIFAVLWLLRFLLGATEAATYPVAARAIFSWMPASKHGVANSIMIAGMPIGSALTPPVIAWLMVRVGWRASFYITSGLALMIAAAWLVYATDRPVCHRGVNRQELALIGNGGAHGERRASSAAPWRMLLGKSMLRLILSYFCEGYVLFLFVFWLFMYLIEARQFSIVAGGFLASVPWVVGAALAPVGGLLCDRLAARRGRLSSARAVIMGGYLGSAVLLFVGINASSRGVAVAALAASLGLLVGAEAGFWSAVIGIAAEHAGMASGAMNTMGILGGIVSTTLVPIMIEHWGWIPALSSGAVVAAACAMMWLLVERPAEDAVAEWA